MCSNESNLNQKQKKSIDFLLEDMRTVYIQGEKIQKTNAL